MQNENSEESDVEEDEESDATSDLMTEFVDLEKETPLNDGEYEELKGSIYQKGSKPKNSQLRRALTGNMNKM